MGKRQALGWLGAILCSVALVVAGGFALSTVAVHRYLQASNSAMHRGESASVGPTPAPTELASVERAVTSIVTMPGVATATSTLDTPSAAATPTPSPAPAPTAGAASTTPDPSGDSYSYDISVIMTPDSTADQCANVVFSTAQQLQSARVNLELSSPAGDGHAASVIDYRSTFDTPVARTAVDSVTRAVAVAAAVPGVKSVRVQVPYTWNVASGDVDVDFASADAAQNLALRKALSNTALSGIDWSTSH